MGASIRFFAVVGPYRDEDEHGWWPNVSHRYLSAFHLAGAPVRAVTISGVGSYLDLAGDPEWGPWVPLAPMFSAPIGKLDTNIVCAPWNMRLGHTVVANGNGYTPATALGTLWTAKMYNVAITCGVRRDDEAELEALRAYDLVIPPHDCDRAELAQLGIDAQRRTPQELVLDLRGRVPRTAEQHG